MSIIIIFPLFILSIILFLPILIPIILFILCFVLILGAFFILISPVIIMEKIRKKENENEDENKLCK
jgi:hypothetical protein